jgi:8-oxo-dGTP diphosphatase
MNANVLAAGAVVWRKSATKDVEVLLIHRPRYDDWSLPKGKLEPGEELIAGAYREVLEETSLDVTFGPFICDVEYFVPDGLKRVSYWAAKAHEKSQEFVANEEADKAVWLPVAKAMDVASRESDREVLVAFLKSPFDADLIVMLRHGKALAREEWSGEDMDRPLAQLGQLQAKRLLSLYQSYQIEEIRTSDAIRCYDTVEPMSRALDIKLKVVKAVSEYSWSKDKEKALEYAKELIKEDGRMILCSHNPVLPRMMEKMTKKIEFDYSDNKLEPGEAWLVFHDKKEVLQIDRMKAPGVTSPSSPSI